MTSDSEQFMKHSLLYARHDASVPRTRITRDKDLISQSPLFPDSNEKKSVSRAKTELPRKFL